MRTCFNNGWQFQIKGDSNWQDVALPHDWLIRDTLNLYKSDVGVYRKKFSLSPTYGQRIILHFDGVYMDSYVYVNGYLAGEWKNGYTAFFHDITSFIHDGENEIIVEVNHVSPNSRWYSGAGIYRDTWLEIKNAAHFVHNGIYITPKREVDKWLVNITAEVKASSEYKIIHKLDAEYETQPDGSLVVKNPNLWDIECPNCYTLESFLIVDGEIQDTAHTRFGFREIGFSPKGGFELNGRRVQINGVCQHHDLGALGAAFNKDAARRQLETLREMGVNAIRTAHNPPAAGLMELTDEMGFVVMTELTDVWKRPKTTYDYARFFDEWVEKDVASWVRRDRNCPSIIMWSVGNEIYDTHADAHDGANTLKQLMNLVRLHDPEDHAPATLCSNYMPWENTHVSADIIKLMGYNYAEYLYHDHHTKNPSWIIYGGETASTVQSRGIYHFPLRKALLADDDLQCSALGNSATSWGAKNSEACIKAHRDAPFTMGQFLWTGTDYIGEPTPYHTKNSHFGQVDTAGFPKDSYYIYKSAWTDYKKAPMIHLFPYWDWSPGQPIDVRIASNAPNVELFLNGKFLGRQKNDITTNYIIPYEPGILKALAYDENGNVIAEAQQHSFGDAASLSTKSIQYSELIFTEISALDIQGNPVENATNRVKIIGDFIGTDNGDSADYDQYTSPSRRLFNGKLLVISKAPIKAEFDLSDIPIRKIELNADGYSITAKTYPPNATYKDLTWRLADASGIDSPLGQLEVVNDGQSAILHPKGDGEVFIRCQAANGNDHPSLISLLPIEIAGFGKPFLDPYSFISGGLYTRSNVELTNGNERGIATLRDGISHVGFDDLDFGPYGSDEITMGLFPLPKEPFDIEIWQGMPDDGRKLCTVRYDKGSIWNTYQYVTYKLPERLTGIQTLCLVFNLKVHVKGFQFKKDNLGKIPFATANHIYGDNFTVKDTAVEGIGNNVTIEFENMTFDNATGLNISWRSQLDKNTIRMSFGDDVINLLTLPTSSDYSHIHISLETSLKGSGTLRFIFLPGSNIDLEWFQFEEAAK
ncbi:MAG: DUF4982 domain-containing protein [Defluviitaleaceae bacterium]|nr:DUF4982 domain-containing protein [Defluviitaleaceae bacterium]